MPGYWVSLVLLLFAADYACPQIYQATGKVYGSDSVQFYFHSRTSSRSELRLDNYTSLQISAFDPTKITVLVVHGYNGGSEEPVSTTIKNATLATLDCNVIVVNYHSLSFPYRALHENSRAIAETAATLINKLIDMSKIRLTTFYCVGHSFGSHICGFTANRINDVHGRIMLIVGIDPAQPMFKNVPPENRLSIDDALRVDILHCSDVLGTPQALGTYDYYFNGGRDQPSCEMYGDNELFMGACSHVLCVHYYAATLFNPKVYPAYPCLTSTAARAGKAGLCNFTPGTYMQSTLLGPRNYPGSYFVPVEGGI